MDNKEEKKGKLGYFALMGPAFLVIGAVCAVFNAETLGIIIALFGGFWLIWLIAAIFCSDKDEVDLTKSFIIAFFISILLSTFILCK